MSPRLLNPRRRTLNEKVIAFYGNETLKIVGVASSRVIETVVSTK